MTQSLISQGTNSRTISQLLRLTKGFTQFLVHSFRLGFKCPITYNPADYYLNVLSDNVLSEFESSAEKPFFDRPIELLRKSFDYRPLDQNLMEPLAIEDHQE